MKLILLENQISSYANVTVSADKVPELAVEATVICNLRTSPPNPVAVKAAESVLSISIGAPDVYAKKSLVAKILVALDDQVTPTLDAFTRIPVPKPLAPSV